MDGPGTDGGGTPDDRFLIADVAALTGVPIPQLRSWERAGLLHPARSVRGVRVYGADDVARARLIKRSLVNPGRRGSLRRLARQLTSGDLHPEPSDYDGLDNTEPSSAEAIVGVGWRAALDAMPDFVAVGDRDGRVVYANPALRAALRSGDPNTVPVAPGAAADAGTDAVPALDADLLSLRWTVRTGIPQQDIRVVLRSADGTERPTLWRTGLVPGRSGQPRGAVAVGRDLTDEQSRAQAREDQLAVAAHDLRAPVATILGNVQLARRVLSGPRRPSATGAALAEGDETGAVCDRPVTVIGDPERAARLARHLKMAESATRDLLRAMETLLDASAAAAGALAQQLDPADVDLRDLVRQAVEHTESLTTRHALTADLPADKVVVTGDPMRLREVLDNVIGNAVKYSPDGGPIEVRLGVSAEPPAGAAPSPHPATSGWATIQVADAGIGIPAADVARVFERYWRAGGMARAVRGTGLGLYASRAVVAAHGGHIWVERTVTPDEASANGADPGRHGTVMAIALPLAKEDG